MKEVAFHKTADLSALILAQTCRMGKTLPKAIFEFMRADGRQTYVLFPIGITERVIGGVEPGIERGALLGEHVSLKYSEMVWKYMQQRTAGGTGGSTVGGWDCAANKVTT
jgi:type VI secretion system secreted protein Hcp